MYFLASILYLLVCIGHLCRPVWTANLATSSADISSSCSYVAERCTSFEKVKTLEAFIEFYEKYNLLNEHLHSKKLSSKCKEAEKTCVENGLHYSIVQSLGQQVKKFETKGEIVCTMIYSMNIYNLHKQLASFESEREPKLMRLLRSLANRWGLKCRSSVPSRLLEVERRAPDAVKHVAFVVNLLFLGISKVAALPLEPDHYVPVLEGEEMVEQRGSSVGRGPSGFEFKLTQQVRLALDGARMSCRALRPYQVNILGSLGLVASLGYGAPLESLDKETRETRALVRKWLISAILCQSLGGLVKQAAVSTDDKQALRLKVLPLDRAEVARVPEDEIGFDELALDEGHLTEFDALSALDSYIHPPDQQAQLRKLQLLTGPSYQMASSIYAYLDLTQLNDRYKIPFAILSLQVPREDPFKNIKDKDNDDDDDEDEEEEEDDGEEDE